MKAVFKHCIALASLSCWCVAQQPELPVEGLPELPLLLETGDPGPTILPAPETLAEVAPATPKSEAKVSLQAAANELRKKAALFRKGKCSKTELLSAAAEVRRAAASYRSALPSRKARR
jgi:hypothetical protein